MKHSLKTICLLLYFLHLKNSATHTIFDASWQKKCNQQPYIIFPHAYSYTIPTTFTKHERLSCFGQLTVGIKTIDSMRDHSGCSKNLGRCLFGTHLHLKDIYLASALAEKNLLTLPGNPAFSGIAHEQYIATLADTNLKFFAQEKQTKVSYDMALNYQFPYLEGNLYGTAGAHICLAKIKHCLQLNTTDGKIGVGNTSGESNVSQFFNSNNIDFLAFFSRTVLKPKGLRFEPFQQQRGISSWALFGELNYTATKPYHPSVTWGINLIFPSTTDHNTQLIWPIIYGKDSKIITELFAEIIGKSENPDLMFNPFAYCSCAFYSPATKEYRIPMLKNNLDPVFLPESFKLYTIKPFEEWDSSIIQFADQYKTISIGPSVRFTGTIGNNFKYIFDSPFSLYAAYRFLYKSKPSIAVINGQGKTFMRNIFEQTMTHKQHSLFFNISFYQGDRLQANIGSQIICGGTNTKEYTKLFFSLFCMF